MKRPFALCLLLMLPLFHTACKSSSVSPADPFFREHSPEDRMEIWFRFHSQLLDEMSECHSYRELEQKDLWAKSVREGIQRDIWELDFPLSDRDKYLLRLRIVSGSAHIRYVDTFLAIRCSVATDLLYIRSIIEEIDRSMDIWDEPSGILGRQEEVLVCAREGLPYASDVDELGLRNEFSALSRAASDAVARSLTLLSQGPEIRRHLRNKPH